MAIVNRFSFPGAVSAGSDVFVAGVGLFKAGVFDVLASDTSALAAVRAILAPIGAVETPNVNTTAAPAPTQTYDPYPVYLRAQDLIESIDGGTDGVALRLKAAFVTAVVDADGGVTLYQNGVEL